MTEQMNIPKLRFCDFDGSWHHYSIKETISALIDCEHKTAPYVDAQDYMVVRTNNIKNGSLLMDDMKYTSKEGFEEWTKRAVPSYGDILFTREAPAGESCLVPKNSRLCLGQRMVLLQIDQSVMNSMFISQLLLSPKVQNTINSYCIGSTVTRINIADINRIDFDIPILLEQQKIASFLSKVDEKITLLTEKKDKLTEYKKGVMQQLFNGKWEEQDGQLVFIPPTLRFKADDGSEFPDWVESRIGDLGHFYYGKSAPKWSVTPEATIPCVRYGELYSKFNGTVDQIYSKTSIPKEKLKFSKGGEVLVPRVGEDPLDFAKCSYLPFSDVAIGEMISVFNTKEDGQFIATYFGATCQKKFARLVEGGNVSNLYFRYLEDVSVCIPSKNEQLKISDFISKVNIKLELLDKELLKAKEWKKGLLQQMFV
ncbi:TPA: restriction endonuclease subunit S [Vibrio parahaemolyticus]|nr:restriction endonuclease subunit S [Vibrio parahaemolyticus]